MNELTIKKLSSLFRILFKKKNRRVFCLILLGLVAVGDYGYLGLARRSFVFYSIIGEDTSVEDRMLLHSGDREIDIRRYVEEVFLGPASPNSAPLFPRGTRLHSFMYREGVVYADLTESAVFPPPEAGITGQNPVSGEGDYTAAGAYVFRSLLTLNEGIKRNFPFVKDVRIFIGGHEVFFEEFREIFANSADN